MLLPRLAPTAGGGLLLRQCLRVMTGAAEGRTTPPTTAGWNTEFVRRASHAAQGRANGKSKGPGKRLGAKKTGEQYVVPGNIIFRQRGTHWFPGENCAMGRDHTIHATAAGYVKYYRDPLRHPKRQYIGVVFARDDVLPYPRAAPRRRRLGMYALPMSSPPEALPNDALADLDAKVAADGVEVTEVPPPKRKPGRRARKQKKPKLVLRPGYMYREANWEIGRAGDRIAARTRPYQRGNRWKAWRKLTERRKRNFAANSMRRKKGGGAKKKKRR